MKEHECKSGNTYGLALAFGILKELEGSIFELMDDEAVEAFSKATQEEDAVDQSLSVMQKLSGKSLRSFVVAKNNHDPQILATVLRTVNGTDIGPDYDSRMSYVREELDYEDGTELIEYLDEGTSSVQDGLAEQEKSQPSSKTGKKRAEADIPAVKS